MGHAPGTSIGHYEILRPLGAGGMGEVYLARDTVLGRRVALKFLPHEITSDERRVRRFESEARTISMLNHPNILTIHELGHEGSHHYIVAEYVEGRTLRELLREPVPLEEALAIAASIGTGLAAAHQSGIVHRDLKPENVMIRTDGLIKLLDFGVASLIEQVADETITGVPEVVGTLPYMSPEQLRAGAVNARSDVYSMGVLLFEMLSGSRPFDAPNKADLIAKILGHRAPALSRFVLDVPAALDDLVAAMLLKEPSERPASMSEVLSTIEAVRRSRERAPQSSEVSVGDPNAGRLPPTNLPADATPLIGRERELQQLEHLLSDSGVRLVTLTGAGGTGKTRLAFAAAARARRWCTDGVFVVPLASVSDASLVIPTIAHALELKELPGADLTLTVQKRLADRRTLLILDNFEQVIGAAPTLLDLLGRAPGLTLLVTSQIALRVRGEREFLVQPLTVPKRSDTVAALQANPSVALFVARATDVNPSFQLTSQNAGDILEICLRLDGLPLAIELAAARSKLLPPATILQKLKEPLAFLKGGARDLPPRQQTLRNAIEWAHALLTPEEQTLFRSLAVFSGGCTAAAVQRICALNLDPESTLEHFSGLIDKSLLQRDPTDPEPRFSMLFSIQSFATELLAAAAERAELQCRHAQYFTELAERVEPELRGATSAPWLVMIDRELHNIRAAANWALGAGEVEIGVRLTTALLAFWLRRAHLSEGLDHLDRLLHAGGELSDHYRLRALYAAGVLAEARGEYAQARGFFNQHLDIQRRREDSWGMANALNNLGVISLREKDYAAADALYRESLAIWRQLGNGPATALSLQNLAGVARAEKRYDAAQDLYRQSEAQFRALGDEFGTAKSVNLLGDLARERGDLDEARRLCEESLEVFIRRTDHREVAGCLGDLGRIEHERGNATGSFELFHESLLIFRELGDAVAASALLDAIGVLVAEQDRSEDALRLAVAAAAIRTAAGVALADHERRHLTRLLDTVRNASGHGHAAEVWRSAESMSLDEAATLVEQQQFG